MGPSSSLHVTLERLQGFTRERKVTWSELLNPKELAAKTGLSEDTVRTLLRGGEPPADTVNERVRERVTVLANGYLARTGKRMSDLAGNISRELGVSAFWARQVCSGEKVPSVEFLHGLVGFFGVGGGEAFFTAPAPEALNRALLPILAALESAPEGLEHTIDPLVAMSLEYDDVRGIALRRARDLPPDRWSVLNATLKALLELDEREDPQ